MAVDPKILLAQLEKQLGRELSADERRLILLAEEIIEKETSRPEAKSAGAE